MLHCTTGRSARLRPPWRPTTTFNSIEPTGGAREWTYLYRTTQRNISLWNSFDQGLPSFVYSVDGQLEVSEFPDYPDLVPLKVVQPDAQGAADLGFSGAQVNVNLK